MVSAARQLYFEVASYDTLSFSPGSCLIPGNPTCRIQECKGTVSSHRPIRSGIIFVVRATMLPNERRGLIGTTLPPRWVRLTTFLWRVPAGINWKGHGALALRENKCVQQGRQLGIRGLSGPPLPPCN